MLCLNSFGKLGALVRSAFATGPDAVIKALFANSEVGAWYDPSDLTTMFQDRAGGAQVTADGQPVGLILDKSKGLVLGPERVISPYSVTGVSWSSTATSVSRSLNGSSSTGAVSTNIPTGGKSYKVTFDISGTSGDTCYVSYGDDIGSPASKRIAADGSYSFVLTATNNGALRYIPYEGGDFAITITNISVKEIAGNHATAPNDSARPLYKTDGTYHWLQFDGVDDTLATAANPLTSATQGTEWHGALRQPGGGDTAVIWGIGNVGSGNETLEPFSGDNVFYSSFLNNERPGFGTIAYSTKYVLNQLKNTNSLTVRKNGAQSGSVATVTSLLGTQFKMCSSSTASSPFYVYSLIILGRLATTQEITDTETWVNGKTGAY